MVRISRVLLKDAGIAIEKTLSEILVCPLSKQPLRIQCLRLDFASINTPDKRWDSMLGSKGWKNTRGGNSCIKSLMIFAFTPKND
ncbi:hypothetical protein Bca101_022190 [Brassica carinata]